MSKSRNAITAEQCRSMGYCPSCGNPISEGVDCCGNGKQSNSKLSPIHDTPQSRIDTGGERQNAPAFKQTAKERAPRKRTKAEMMALDKAKSDHGYATIIPHGIKLFFEDGTAYTPDIVIYPPTTFHRPLLVEVKGGYLGPGWEQGYERFRRARDVFEHFDFQMWTWDRKKQAWRVE